MTVFAVLYSYNDATEHRLQVRPKHRAWLADRLADGHLLASGPLVDGAPGALLVFRSPSRDELEAVLAQDPFASAGVLAGVEVREWEQVLGPWAAAR